MTLSWNLNTFCWHRLETTHQVHGHGGQDMTIIHAIQQLPVVFLLLLSTFQLSSPTKLFKTHSTKLHDIQNLLNFVSELGGDVSKLNIHINTSTLSTTINSKVHIKRGQLTMYVPLNALLSYDKIWSSIPEFKTIVAPSLKKIQRPNPNKVECVTTLSLFLTLQKLIIKEQSTWHYFVNTLPEISTSFGLPQHEWVDKEAIAILQTCPFGGMFHGTVKNLDILKREQHEMGLNAALTAIANVAGVSIEYVSVIHTWALKSVLTRTNYQTFSEGRSICMMMPVLELADHESVTLPLKDDGGFLPTYPETERFDGRYYLSSGGVVLLQMKRHQNNDISATTLPLSDLRTLTQDAKTFDLSNAEEINYAVGIRASKDITPGAPIHNNYYAGNVEPPCHTDLLFAYGFLPNDTTTNEWCVDFRSTQLRTFDNDNRIIIQTQKDGSIRFNQMFLQSLDDMYPQDRIIKNTKDVHRVVSFKIRESWKIIPNKIMAVMRLNLLDNNELTMVQSWWPTENDNDRMREVARRISQEPITERNEIATLKALNSLFNEFLNKIPGTEKIDNEKLKTATLQRRTELQTALRVRIHERRICSLAVELVLQQENKLHQEKKYSSLPYSSSFTPRDFYTRFELTETPLKIQAPSIPYWSASQQTWDLHYFKHHCGNSAAKVSFKPPGTDGIYIPFSKWNKIFTTFSKYADFLLTNDSSTAEIFGLPKNTNPLDTYLFDWSLSNCKAAVLDDFVVPRWFANDILNYQTNVWPSIFVGPSGFSHSPLHRDTFGSAFYSIQLAGTKIWRIYNSKDSQLLYPLPSSVDAEGVYFQVTDTFSKEQQEKYPDILRAPYVDIPVNPGELLYVPAGSPHQVLSTNTGGPTVMAAMNYIQYGNLATAIEATSKFNFTENIKYAMLAEFLLSKSNNDWKSYTDWNINHTSYRDLVARQLENATKNSTACMFAVDFKIGGESYQVSINGLNPEADRVAKELSEKFRHVEKVYDTMYNGIGENVKRKKKNCELEFADEKMKRTKYCQCIIKAAEYSFELSELPEPWSTV